MSTIVAEHGLDGGYSGQLSVRRTRPIHSDVNPDLIFVESDLTTGHLTLTREQAADLAAALTAVIA